MRAIVAMSMLATALVAGCQSAPRYAFDQPTTSIAVPVEPLRYAPLVPRLPLTLGLSLGPGIRDNAVDAGGGDVPRIRYQTGAALSAYLTTIFEALFERVVVLDERSTEAQATPIDLVASVAGTSTYYGEATVQVLFASGRDTDIARIELSSVAFPSAATDASPAAAVGSRARVRVADLVGEIAIAIVTSEDLAHWIGERSVVWSWPTPPPSADTFGTPAVGCVILSCREGHASCTADDEAAAIRNELQRLDASLAFADAEMVAAAGFPWLRGSMPEETVVRERAFTLRLGKVGVRHLVLIRAIGQYYREHGSIGAFAGYGGGGFLGYKWWTRRETATLEVYDLSGATTSARVAHDDESTSLVMPAFVLPVPIPIPQTGPGMHEAVARKLLPLLRP